MRSEMRSTQLRTGRRDRDRRGVDRALGTRPPLPLRQIQQRPMACPECGSSEDLVRAEALTQGTQRFRCRRPEGGRGDRSEDQVLPSGLQGSGALRERGQGTDDLDYGAGVEEFVNIVSENDSLQVALSPPGTSGQSAPVAAILDVVYGILPICKVIVEGVLDDGDPGFRLGDTHDSGRFPPGRSGHSDRPEGREGHDDAERLARLARPAALWIHYESAHLTRITKEGRLPGTARRPTRAARGNRPPGRGRHRRGRPRLRVGDLAEPRELGRAGQPREPARTPGGEGDASARARAIADVRDGLNEMKTRRDQEEGRG